MSHSNFRCAQKTEAKLEEAEDEIQRLRDRLAALNNDKAQLEADAQKAAAESASLRADLEKYKVCTPSLAPCGKRVCWVTVVAAIVLYGWLTMWLL